MDNKGQQIYSIRLSDRERRALARLAQESGRPQAQVIRRLILAAAMDPRSMQALGNLSERKEAVKP